MHLIRYLETFSKCSNRLPICKFTVFTFISDTDFDKNSFTLYRQSDIIYIYSTYVFYSALYYIIIIYQPYTPHNTHRRLLACLRRFQWSSLICNCTSPRLFGRTTLWRCNRLLCSRISSLEECVWACRGKKII